MLILAQNEFNLVIDIFYYFVVLVEIIFSLFQINLIK